MLDARIIDCGTVLYCSSLNTVQCTPSSPGQGKIWARACFFPSFLRGSQIQQTICWENIAYLLLGWSFRVDFLFAGAAEFSGGVSDCTPKIPNPTNTIHTISVQLQLTQTALGSWREFVVNHLLVHFVSSFPSLESFKLLAGPCVAVVAESTQRSEDLQSVYSTVQYKSGALAVV